MHDRSSAAAVDAAADPTVPRRSLTSERRWAASASEQLERAAGASVVLPLTRLRVA